jgi:N-acylneuraminate cytidylyltransferase
MSAVAIITARGGSKRIPRKNIRNFLGKPILSYAIETARQSSLFDEIMVSTDDNEIADIALSFGAKVPFRRSARTATDFATTPDVLLEVLDTYEQRGTCFDFACCIYPVSPLLTPELLERAYQKLRNGSFDSVYPVQRFGFPIQRAFYLRNDRIGWLHPEFALTRSQELERAFHDAGQFYWFNVPVFRRTGKLLTDNTSCVEISDLQAQDVDNESDWQMAELKYRLLHP